MKRKRTRRHEFALVVPFENQVRTLPGRQRPALLTWIHAWRKRPGRIFWLLDGNTGEWRRV